MAEYPEAQYFIYTSDTDVNGAELEQVETNKWGSYNDYTKVWYAAPGKISQNLLKQVEKIKPDIIFMVGLYSWHFTLVPLIYCKSPRKIISVRGMLHPGALAQKKWKKWLFIKSFRLFEWQYKTDFHATNDEEKVFIINSLGKQAKVHIAPNFPTLFGYRSLPSQSPDLRLISIGLVTQMKNILLVLESLRSCNHHIDYLIYGAIKDEEYYDECRKLAKQLPENISVTFNGELPFDKVENAIHDAHVFILPSRSENFGHAIFEALSAGRPVITSDFTPWNGLEKARAGINVDLTSKSLYQAIDFFAEMSEIELSEWSEGARAYAVLHYEKEAAISAYQNMFANLPT